ncbi:helix-turn-helix transcriptional regulator [uncultured Clostridium sp.]|uniref:helix-turn-helix domain-containing protein n=1 Tax=uncultured Clostridium sp. TaxID=59620 RepID=UPI00261F9571|nr:helix-turn-helix transcriptional regulator [uncultured Clostridium sp.]
MVRLRVDEILKKKKKSVYWLYINYFPSMGYTNLNNVIKNKTQRVSYETLEKFSEALDVPVSELLEKIPNKE